MTTRLPSLSALRAFEAAARLNSFKKAAEELAVTATAISHRIRVLEEDLERPLFVRKVRAVELTPDGQTLLAAVSSGFQAIAMAIEQVRRPRRASVTLSATPAFATKWLVPRLAAFQTVYPDIDLHVHASNAPVDLNAGTADLAIRYGHGHYPGLTATLLLEDRFAPVASPTIRAAIRQEASQWPLIHFDWHRPLPMDLTWAAWMRASGHPPSDLSTGIRYSEESHAIQAAVASQGVALLSLVLVEEELRMGLLEIVAEPVLKGMSYHVLKPGRRSVSDAVLAVEDWLVRSAETTHFNISP
ncbi:MULTISPECIES: LysR substrate-binding domain-containing protein [unclassified Brenneria]|uniref:LysR substrate-binding domain-containing protein n=1 Tax=unclassified Brenneria TaxID=2634434 RepID=UPI0029C382EA|nr:MULTISPECIES: LysR substrate-binding domain-containing protein [unclassified Brenneria]MDX5627130.1 LysR substrate-binding domain-containing protein [Brenneria sp. L3-3Z]MDX5693520.1 LysR substrate-binding domain-containing protein [Brenneria sp. L4-2C]